MRVAHATPSAWLYGALWLSLCLPLSAWASGTPIPTQNICQEPNCPDKNPKPSVSLTAPVSGTTATAPASFTLTATATDANGIAKVDFYSNSTLIGSDTSSPYSVVYANVPAGSYILKAVATDSLGATNTSATATITVTAPPANTPPTVSLTAPANGATATAPASFTLTATAADSNGSISKVAFYSNNALIGSDTSSPYSVAYTNVPVGSYSLKAIATDNQGAATTSAAISVSVTTPPANTPPTVSLTAPVSGATATAPASFTLTATASDANGSVAKVDFYSNSTLIGSDTSSPYSVVYASVPAGSYSLKAIATDNQGAATTSAAISVTVTTPPANTPPTVSLTAPVNGATAVALASFTVTATASDANGSVAKVDFYSNTTLIGSDSSSPYSLAYTNVPAGSYSLKAIATDNQGTTTTSAAISVSVTAAPVSPVSLTRTYVYDANQRLCKTIDPEAGATIIDYDAASNVAWTVQGSTLTTATCDRASVSEASKSYRRYDAFNRITDLLTPDGSANLTTTYELDGRVKTLTANNPSTSGHVAVTTTYSYNKRRLLTTETSSQPGLAAMTVGYGYNANGHASTLTYPNSLIVDYAPNALGQPSKVGTYATSLSYYPNGAIKQFTYGNGIVHTLTQNTRQLPSRSQDKNGSTAILDDSYVYDANGNVTDITDAAQNGLTTRGMAYDARDRLTTAVAPKLWGNATYTYDALDNLRTATLGSAGYTYGYDSKNRLTTLARTGGSTYSYKTDVRGNITSDGRQAYQFDLANRLSQVTGKESYRYDGLGRRTATTDLTNSVQTRFQYSQAGSLLYVDDPKHSQFSTNIYLGNSLLATRSVAYSTGTISVKYQHTDALGSPVAVTDPSKAVTERTSYSPFGAPLNHPVAGIGYTGHVMDQATGLVYAQQRYFDPQLGRFLSMDPMAVDTDTGWNFNRFAYAQNSPYTFSDPDGRQAKSFSSNACGLTGCGDGTFIASDNSSQEPEQTAKETPKEPANNSFANWIDGIADSINPFMSSAECIRDGCGSGGWVMAGIALVDLLPSPRDAAQVGARAAAKEIAKPSLSAHKKALSAVQEKVGKLTKGEPGKFGSPQAGTSKKGYRLDPPHNGVAKGDAEAGYHFNWWDYSAGKRGNGGSSGAIPIGD